MLILLGNSLAPTLIDCFKSCVSDDPNAQILPASLGKFVSGEAFAEPQATLEDIQNQPIVIVQSLASVEDQTPQDLLWQSLMAIRKLKDKCAGPIWMVMPFAAYGRQDREFDGRMTSVAIDDLGFALKQFGAAGVSTVELHSDAGMQLLENHFGKGQVFNLDPTELYAAHAREQAGATPICVGGPDEGAHLRADTLGTALGAQRFQFTKRHSGVNQTEVTGFEGDVKGAHTITVDDMVDTGGTIVNSQLALANRGATMRDVYTAHGIFSNDGLSRLFTAKTADGGDQTVSKLVVTDTIDISAGLAALRRQYGDDAVDDRISQISVGTLLYDHIADDIAHHDAMTMEVR